MTLLPMRWFTASIQNKMLAAFLAVSVIPMLVSAVLSSRVVSFAFDQNVETWLRETSELFLKTIQETRDEALGVGSYIANEPSLMQDLLHDPAGFDNRLKRLTSAVGYDLIAIYDTDKHIEFANPPLATIDAVPLADDRSLYRVVLGDGTARIMAAGVRRIDMDGRTHFLVLGTFLNENFISSFQSVTSLEMRLYFREGDRFVEFYSSRGNRDFGQILEEMPRQAILDSRGRFYDPAAEGDEYRAIYTPLRNDQGDIVGVLFCGLRETETLTGLVSETNLFVVIFLLGAGIAILSAALLSQPLVRPLRQLARGVRAIGAGDFNQRVQPTSRDEVAELAQAFNSMAERLGQLRIVEAQLRRKDRMSALGQVAAGIAHEVRNPLGIIKTSVELIRRKGVLPAEDDKLIEFVLDEVKRIDGLIGNFLAFARPPGHKPAPLRAMDIVERIQQFSQPELDRSGISIAIVDRSGDAQIEADANSLFEAFLNLMLNAIDAMPNGGHIAIEVESNNSDVLFRFTDSGRGISPDVLDRIFNPFFTTKAKGSGLGLSKVFGVVEAHGGFIDVSSRIGEGTTFLLGIPRLKQTELVTA